MNAGSLSAVVVAGSCSSFSAPTSAGRHAGSTNVGFFSAFLPPWPCRCALSLYPALGKSSFLYLPPGHRERSTERMLVAKGSSTFERREEGAQGLQVAERARRVVTGRVAWSVDGKPTILWPSTKQPGKGVSDNEERRLSAERRNQNEAELTGQAGVQDARHAISEGEHRDFFAPKNRQSTARLPEHIPTRPSTPPPRQRTEIFDSSSAPRLPTGASDFRRAVEPDTLGAPISPIQRAASSVDRNAPNQFDISVPLRREDNNEAGLVSTSKLEEILNDFRNRQQWEERWRDRKNRRGNPDDAFSEAGLSSRGSSSHANSRESTSNNSFWWQSSGRDHQNATYGRPNHANSSDESPDAIEEHGKVFYGKGNFASRLQNHGQKETDPEPQDLPKNSPLATSWKSRRGRSPVSDLESSVRNRGSASAEGRAATYDHMQSNASSSFSKSKGKFWTNDKRGLLAREKGIERPHDESSDAIEEHEKVFRGKGSFASRHQNHAHKETDPETLDPPNSPLATPWKSRRGRSPVSDLESTIRNRSSASAEGQVATYSRMQSNSSSSYSKSKGKLWTNHKSRLLAREKGTERPHDNDTNQDPQFHMSRGHGDNLDEDNSVGIALHTESELADDSSRPVQSKKLTASLITVKQEPLIKDKKATWHSQPNSSLPFEYQFSYSETPSAPIIRYREKPYSPFGPRTMSRPWTGGPPLKKSKKNLPMFDSFNPPPKGKKGVKHVQDPGPYPPGQGPKPARSRDEIHGEPLTNEEIAILIDDCRSEKRQLNLGRDGLTHNMLDLVHCHWKRRRVIRVRCLGVPTVDMDNVCFHLEDKTGGKVIYHSGGMVYLFRGRNYNYKDRPEIPLMLWKPITPVYPKLITRAPGGLTEEEADQLRELGKKVEPLCRLSKNGIYYKLVEDVRVAFTLDKLVRIDCHGLNPSDYKKIGAKLKDLVPCVLLSFDNEQILMWKGKETSTDPESSKASVAEALSEESSVVDTGLPSPRDLEGYDTDLTGAFNDISHSKLLKEHISPEVSMETKLSASSEVSISKALATQSEQDWDEPNLLFQNSWAHRENDTASDGMMSNTNRLPEDTLVEAGSHNKLTFWTEGRERITASQAVVGLQSSLITLDNVESVEAAEDSADNCGAVRFDDLWDQAITSGTAVKLDDGEMDNDNVVTRARKLAGEVPAGEDYTRKLIKSLQIRAPRLSQPNQDLHKHLRRIKKMKLEKKLRNRRSFRNQGAELQAFHQDGHGNNGMNVDELAQLLSMR